MKKIRVSMNAFQFSIGSLNISVYVSVMLRASLIEFTMFVIDNSLINWTMIDIDKLYVEERGVVAKLTYFRTFSLSIIII